jgi:regulatory protein
MSRRSRPPRRRDPRVRPELDAKAARLAAIDLLARKAWTRRELARRLARRGAPPEVAAAVVAELAERGYLDDESLALAWAEIRARVRKVGSIRLRQELGRRGVARELADRAVERAFEETPELDRALAAGRRRLPALRRARPERLAGRLAEYLLRRGYPGAIVRQAVKALVPDAPGVGEADPDAGV